MNQEEAVNSEIAILQSRDMIEKVINAIKIERIYPEISENPPAKMSPMDAAIIAFSKKLNVEAVKKSNVLEITFRHKNPLMAAAAVKLLVDFYREKHLEVYSSNESGFLDSQMAAYDRKLKDSANNLESFKQKTGVYSLDEQRSLLLRQRSDLDTALKASVNSVEELQRRLVSLQGLKQSVARDSSLYTGTERDKIIVDARAKLLSLQIDEQELLKKYREENRLVQQVRKEIRTVNNFLAEQESAISGKTRTGNVVYQETEKDRVKTEADLNAQRAKAAVLRGQVAQVDGELRNLDLQDKKLQELKRNSANMEKNYQTYLEKSEEARISDDMNRNKLANVSVIQAATIPTKPVKPKKLLNCALGMVLGGISGIGYAFLMEYLTQVFSTPRSAERRLGLPLLCVITDKGQ